MICSCLKCLEHLSFWVLFALRVVSAAIVSVVSAVRSVIVSTVRVVTAVSYADIMWSAARTWILGFY